MVVILMVVLSGPEDAGGQDFGRDGSREASTVLQAVLGRFSDVPLVFVMVEDGRAIRIAAIIELSAWIGRIDLSPEPLDEFLVGNACRIKGNFDRLPMARAPGADFRVGRVLLVPARVT